MKSPKDMRIIQIDVTNACVFQCSNCTRFCGHYKKPFFMDFETFKKAVDSLDGYVGTIGMMGGEPTLNPEFEKMAEYLASKKPEMLTDKMLRPQRHFMDGIHDLEFEHTFLYPCQDVMRQTVDGPGLWATTKGNYKKYYETIQDTAQYQALNDHSRPMYHQPSLITRKDLGISDEEWIPMRDKCWIQNEWSASITPKGAFFCEMAASLDMLFDGPGGWPVEPGWWKRTPEEFGDQLQWCEKCGLACKTFMRNANELVYDVSPSMFDELKKTGSRLVGTDHINVVEINDGIITEESKAEGKRFSAAMPYTESYSARFDEENTSLTKKEIIGFIVIDKPEEVDCAAENIKHFDNAVVYVPKALSDEIMEKSDSLVKYYNSEEASLGEALDSVIGKGHYEQYVMIIEGNVKLRYVLEDLKELVLNPGTLLFSAFGKDTENEYFKAENGGCVALLSGAAKSYAAISKEQLCSFTKISEIAKIWEQRKVFEFSPETVYTAPTVNIEKGKRYVIYGCGMGLRAAIDSVINGGAKVVALVDTNEKIWGSKKYDYVIQNPDEVLSDKDSFDNVMIGSFIYYRGRKKVLLNKGIEERKMAWI
ncbi:MAG: radical SAM protein [Eubacterium sp.]|nr:radical SAM protein [Eubacterium sp.]